MAQSSAVRGVKPVHIRAHDVYGMALKLLELHGPAALEVAAFAEAEHDVRGDRLRKAAWKAVESTLSDMLLRRLSTSGLTIH